MRETAEATDGAATQRSTFPPHPSPPADALGHQAMAKHRLAPVVVANDHDV
jgi:hypothetical protein